MDLQRFWRSLSQTARAWLIVGAIAATAVVVGVCIILIASRPWESREYKDCVRLAQNQLGKDFSTSDIEGYCHQIYD